MRLFQCVGIFICIIQFPPREIEAASAHIRTRFRDSKEKIESGRDAGHYDSAGVHNDEFDHQAILGSIRDAEEFDKLPIEESKKRLRLLLGKMDLNKDEFIDRDELKKWILRSFSMLADEESADRLEDADSNEDGRVTWQELVSDTYGFDLQDLEAENVMIEEDREMFLMADANKDGFLDKEEFKAFTHPEENPRMHEVLIRQTIKKHDENKDNRVNFEEYLGEKSDSDDREYVITEKERFNTLYDANRDGYLEYSEIPSWIIHHDERIAVEEVNHLFENSDDDKDGRLSFQEIIDHHDVFVGSEATDYGDHLQDIDRFMDEL